MKRSLFLGIAGIALMGAGMQAHAGSYSDNSSRMMNDAHHMKSGMSSSQKHASKNKDKERVSNVEPAAGRDKNPYDDFTGIYAGGDIGYAFTDDLEGWNGGLFAGYGFVHEFDMIGAYAGAEIGYEWGGADGSAGGLSYEKDHAWNFSLRPGVKIMEDGLGYAIIGYSRAEFEGGGGGDEDLDGLILGLGGQFDTNTVFKTRLEYTWTNYEDGNINGTSFDANENAIKLGAVFQF